MAIVNLGELLGSSRSGSGRRSLAPDGLTVKVGKAGGDRRTLAIGISEGAMKAARWVIGDRVTIGVDLVDRLVAIRRVVPTSAEMSWKLSRRNGGKSVDGEVTAATLKVTITPTILKAFGIEETDPPRVIREYTTSENGIMFYLTRK